MNVAVWLWPAAAGALAAVLGLLALRQRARARRLEHLLAATSGRMEQLQLQFARFVPGEVVERLAGPEADVAPHRRRVTALFADLQGFTRMCERQDPVETVDVLNGYFRCMSEVIAARHGHVTEMVGDELLALFGALENNPWQARDAVLAALDMREALVRYNAGLRGRDVPPLRFGIGIHQGEVLAGVIGHEGLSKFGVVGDPINVASRVERLTRTLEVDLLITEEVRAGLGDQFQLRPMPALEVRGKSEPIATWHVEGLARPA
jgi:adenylate cyclase